MVCILFKMFRVTGVGRSCRYDINSVFRHRRSQNGLHSDRETNAPRSLTRRVQFSQQILFEQLLRWIPTGQWMSELMTDWMDLWEMFFFALFWGFIIFELWMFSVVIFSLLRHKGDQHSINLITPSRRMNRYFFVKYRKYNNNLVYVRS